MVNLIICGINGRLGHSLVNCTEKSSEFSIVAGVDKNDTPINDNIPIYQNISEVAKKADIIIDFSRPDALKAILEFAKKHNMGVVLATTGYTQADKDLIYEYTHFVPVFFSANMSLGVNLQIELTKKAAEFLGDSFDIEIIEKHHNRKVDSPSGTALAIAEGLNNVFLNSKEYKYGRTPKSTKREQHEIGIHAVRGGSIVGEHNVEFLGEDEIIEVTHKALSTQVFANGALRAASYLTQKKPRLYSMTDIISETNTVTNIRAEKNVSIFKINKIKHCPSFIADIFNALADKDINLDIISQTLPNENQVSIAFSLPSDDLEVAKKIITSFSTKPEEMDFVIYENVTKISIEGMGMERQSGVAAKLFDALSKYDIKILIISTSETKISFCVENSDFKNAVQSVTNAFKL